MFLEGNLKSDELVVHKPLPIINIWKNYTVHSRKVSSLFLLCFYFKNCMEICAPQVGCFKIFCRKFNSMYVYSVFWNKSILFLILTLFILQGQIELNSGTLSNKQFIA